MTKQEAVDLCFLWHGGGGSATYQFASNGGELEDRLHQQQLLKEIYENIAWSKDFEGKPDEVNDPEKDIPQLEALVEYVKALPVDDNDSSVA